MSDENQTPEQKECDHSKNTNLQIAQSVVDLSGKLLLLISCKCSECKNVHMVLKEIPMTMGPVTTTPVITDRILHKQ